MRSSVWWYDFIFAGKRIRESTETTRKTVARDAETNKRRELERAYAGLPTQEASRRVQSVSELVKAYKANYEVNHRPKSVQWVKDRTAHVTRLMGNLLLPDLTEARVTRYMQERIEEGAGNRTVNMELLCLSRAIGKTWRELWPKVKKLEEPTSIGRALSMEEERAILAAAMKNNSPLIHPFIRIALLTAMRHDEIRKLQWKQIDLEKRVITVGKAKTSAGTGREIPMNQDLYATLSMHASWYAKRFGPLQPDWYVFPRSNRAQPTDPTQPATAIKTAGESVRKEAGVILSDKPSEYGKRNRRVRTREKREKEPEPLKCRFHDLRHTTLTKMAEAGVPESTMLALAGHMSRAMLERYNHIRMAAKRTAMDAISLASPERVSNVLPKDSTKVGDSTKTARLV